MSIGNLDGRKLKILYTVCKNNFTKIHISTILIEMYGRNAGNVCVERLGRLTLWPDG